MPLWDWIPPYAEEITINQVQETLSNFNQLIPEGFVELKQLNWMCSTQGWKEPACERYNCLINDEWKQVDIRHTLLERLGITNNIPHPVYVSPAILDRGVDRYLAYNVENEEEIFLQKSFTVENLEENINGLLEKIEELKRELEKEKGWWDKWVNDESDLSDFSYFVFTNYPENMNMVESFINKNRYASGQRYHLFNSVIFRGDRDSKIFIKLIGEYYKNQ